jgi:hypothetical protein
VLRDAIDGTQIHDLPFKRWLDDETQRANALYLLNQLLGRHLRQCVLQYNPHFRRSYFPREDNEQTVFKKEWINIRTGRKVKERIVVKQYQYGFDVFWRHLAAHFSWRQMGNDWYLQITPKYLFTADGEQPYDRTKIGPYTTSLKAKEFNPNVLNHVLFFADVLAQGTALIQLQLFGLTLVKIRKEPVSAIAPFAIPYDPAIYEDVDEDQEQLDMFNLLGIVTDDEEDDTLEEGEDELED